MTATTVNSVAACTTSAQFQAIVQEIYTALVTTCGLGWLPATMDTGQMAVPCATAIASGASTSQGYYMFFFNDPLALGPINTVAAITGGTGYNGGTTHTFTGVPLTGGTGTGAQASVVCTSGVVTAVTITTAGTGYCIGDQLSASNANLGGSGSGFSCFVNSTTSAASPCVMKIEFGSGSAATDIQLWITMGTTWASNGTVGGTTTTRVTCLTGGAPLSTTATYNSRYCYNTTYGFLGLVLKQAAVNATGNAALGAIFVFRATGTAGTPVSNGMNLLTINFTNSNPGNNVNNGFIQCLSYTNSVIYPTLSSTNSVNWAAFTSPSTTGFLFGLTTTLESGNAFVMPIYTMDPVIRYSGVLGIALAGDFPLNSTSSLAIIGSTSLTFLSLGLPWGSGGFANIGNTNQSLVMLFQ